MCLKGCRPSSVVRRPSSVVRRPSNRLLYRLTLLGKKLRPAVGDVQTILEPNTELAVAHDRRFVTEAHSGLNRRLVPPHEVCPLVPVQADSVPRAVRKPGNLVVGTVAGVGDHRSRGGVHRFAGRAHLRGREGRVLRLLLEPPHVALTLRRLPEDRRACDIGLVAFYSATAI